MSYMENMMDNLITEGIMKKDYIDENMVERAIIIIGQKYAESENNIFGLKEGEQIKLERFLFTSNIGFNKKTYTELGAWCENIDDYQSVYDLFGVDFEYFHDCIFNDQFIPLAILSLYLPFRVECQYTGITNGSELGKYDKEYNKSFEKKDYNPPAEEYGLKIGKLRNISVFKNYYVAYIGKHNRGQKSFYNGRNFVLILKDMAEIDISDLKLKFDNHIDYITTEWEYWKKKYGIEKAIEKLPKGIFDYLISNLYDVFDLKSLKLAVYETDI